MTAQIIATFQKASAATLDYQIDWSDMLGADTIATSSWDVPTGITSSSPSNTTTTATIFLAGGTLGQQYIVTNTVTTAGGRTDTRSFALWIGPRAGVVNLLRTLRGITDAGSGDYVLAGETYWSDRQLQDQLDAQRKDWRRVALIAQPELGSDGAYDYFDYKIPLEIGVNFEEAGTGSIWAVKTTAGAVISTSDYAVNYPAGVIRFTADQAGASFYLDCRTFNLNAAARAIWEMKAAHAAAGVQWRTDNHQVNAEQEYEHCMQQAERFRKLGAGIRMITMRRTDEAWGQS